MFYARRNEDGEDIKAHWLYPDKNGESGEYYDNKTTEEEIKALKTQKPGITFKDVDIKLVSITEGQDSNQGIWVIENRDTTNINGYFPRLKNLNNQIKIDNSLTM